MNGCILVNEGETSTDMFARKSKFCSGGVGYALSAKIDEVKKLFR